MWPFLCQSHTVLMTVALRNTLKLGVQYLQLCYSSSGLIWLFRVLVFPYKREKHLFEYGCFDKDFTESVDHLGWYSVSNNIKSFTPWTHSIFLSAPFWISFIRIVTEQTPIKPSKNKLSAISSTCLLSVEKNTKLWIKNKLNQKSEKNAERKENSQARQNTTTLSIKQS